MPRIQLSSVTDGSPLPLLCCLQLFSDDTAQDIFYGLLLTVHMFSEGFIQHRLIITTALFLHLWPEPVDNVSIKSNGNPYFLSRAGNYGTPLPLLKSYFAFILSHLVTYSLSFRNYSNYVFSPCVCYYQYTAKSVHSNSDIALLTFSKIFNCEGIWIFIKSQMYRWTRFCAWPHLP